MQVLMDTVGCRLLEGRAEEVVLGVVRPSKNVRARAMVASRAECFGQVCALKLGNTCNCLMWRKKLISTLSVSSIQIKSLTYMNWMVTRRFLTRISCWHLGLGVVCAFGEERMLSFRHDSVSCSSLVVLGL